MRLQNRLRLSVRDRNDPDTELKVLEWKYRDFLQLSRLEGLQRLLDTTGGISVSRFEPTRSRFGLFMLLDNGWTVRLKLHQPIDDSLQVLDSIAWSDRVSWIVSGRSNDGEPVRYYAWRVIVEYHGEAQSSTDSG